MATSFTCPECGAVSYHPQDIAHGYCGRCHRFTGVEQVLREALGDQRYERLVEIVQARVRRGDWLSMGPDELIKESLDDLAAEERGGA